MPSTGIKVQVSPEEQQIFDTLNTFPRFVQAIKTLKNKNKEIDIHYPALGVICSPNATESVDPIDFRKPNGIADKICTYYYDGKMNLLIKTALLFIEHQWDFQPNHPTTEFKGKKVRPMGDKEHFFKADWEKKFDIEIPLDTPPRRRLEHFNQIRAKGKAMIKRFTDNVERLHMEDIRREADLLKDKKYSADTRRPKPLKDVSCAVCGKCVLPDPWKCVGHKVKPDKPKMCHLSCKIKKSKALEVKYCMSLKSFPCVPDT